MKFESEGLKVNEKYNDCERSFTKRCNLNRHMQEVHNIESRFDIDKLTVLSYPFKCDQCDKKYKRKDHLKLHKDPKHGFVMFECGQCKKVFTVKSNLARHQLKVCDNNYVGNKVVYELIDFLLNTMFAKHDDE